MPMMIAPVALPPWGDYNTRAAIIVVVAIRVSVVRRRRDTDAYTARSRVEANLRHRGCCRREECRSSNDAECEFSHESLLSLLTRETHGRVMLFRGAPALEVSWNKEIKQ